MKIECLLGLVILVVATGCSTSHPATHQSKTKAETVLVTYHVKVGKEADFEATLARAWAIYRKGGLVYATPHVVVRDTEEGGQPRFAEIFTWVDRSTPEHAPESVKAIWKEEEALCEKRGGHYGIEPGEVHLILPAGK
jgi:hypothetical protein